MHSFHNIPGNDELKKSLIQQVNSGRLHHAHLFVGKMGHYTTALAMSFLKYLYCTDRKDDDSCHECSNCSKIDQFQHVDIHFTFPSFKKDKLSKELMSDFKQIYTDYQGVFDLKDWMDYHGEFNAKIRELECDIILSNMTMTAYSNGHRAQVIWMVERMGNESNKILKILEEPSPDSIFILIAETTERILPTIISRCNLHKVQAPEQNFLHSRLMTDFPDHKPDLIDKAIIFSEGDQIAARRYLSDLDLDFSLEDSLKLFLKGLVKFEERKFSNIQNMFLAAEGIASQNKSNHTKFLEYTLYIVHQIVLYKTIGKADVSENMEPVVAYFSGLLEIDQIEEWMNLLDRCLHAVQGNANVKISFVSLGIEMGRVLNRQEFEIYHQ